MNSSRISWTHVATSVAQLSEHFICFECRAEYTTTTTPKTAECGHTLCSGCWRGLRACPVCSEHTSPARRSTNVPFETLAQHTRELVGAFQVLFHVKPDEYLNNIQTEPDLVSITEALNNWICNSQNQLSKSETHVQVHTEDMNSANDIFIKETLNPSKVIHKNLAQDDWDKIEVMPDSDENCPIDKNGNGNVQEIQKMTARDDEPRRSSRIRNGTPKVESSSGKKKDKPNRNWSSIKRMKKEFSKLNKIGNRNKLNVSIEMIKKARTNVKEPRCNSNEIVTIEENPPGPIPCQTSNHEHSLDSIKNTKTDTSHTQTSKSVCTSGTSKVLFLQKGPLYTKQSLAVVAKPETTGHKQFEDLYIDIRIGNMTASLVIDKDRDVKLNVNKNSETRCAEKNVTNNSSTVTKNSLVQRIQVPDIHTPIVHNSIAEQIPQDKAPVNTVTVAPTRVTIAASPVEMAIDATPCKEVIDASFAEVSIHAPPFEMAIDAVHSEAIINATPAEAAINASFAQLPIDATPSEAAIDATPSEAAIDATPSEAAIDATPSEAVIGATPSEAAIDATPSEAAIDATPCEGAAVPPHAIVDLQAEETVPRGQSDKRAREPCNMLPNKKARLDAHSDTWASLDTADEKAMADVCEPVEVALGSIPTVSLSPDSDGSVVEDTPHRDVSNTSSRPSATPVSITKFADDIQYKSTPLTRKTLDFSECTLCPTDPVVAADSPETATLVSKALEKSQDSRVPRVAGSNLKIAQLNYLKTLCSRKRWTFTEKYTQDLTHLVVAVDEENTVQRTVKYMCALAAGCWIVSFAWAERCMELSGTHPAPEEAYEALDSTGADGPRRSRLRLRAGKRRIFAGFAFRCEPPFALFDVPTLESVLKASGARLLRTVEEAAADGEEPRILLAESDDVSDDRFTYMALHHGVVPVNLEWVLDCLGGYSLQPLRKMLLCPASLVPDSAGRRRRWLLKLMGPEDTQPSLPGSQSPECRSLLDDDDDVGRRTSKVTCA